MSPDKTTRPHLLPDGRAVRALHIVCQNLQLRLGVYAGLVGQQQVLVRLHGVSLLRIMTNKDLAVEDRARFAVKNSFVKLVTRAMRLPVIDDRMRIGVLITGHQVQAIHPALGAFMVHRDAHIVPGKLAAKVNRGRIV